VLTRAHRLTSGTLFGDTVRRGRRAGSRTLVVHLLPQQPDGTGREPKIGFVVSKAVGPAVVRNHVKRRLRHLTRERVASLPGAAVLVVRALPAAATVSFAQLGEDLDRALDRALGRPSRVTRAT
jgi:ribonuclease P protein component